MSVATNYVGYSSPVQDTHIIDLSTLTGLAGTDFVEHTVTFTRDGSGLARKPTFSCVITVPDRNDGDYITASLVSKSITSTEVTLVIRFSLPHHLLGGTADCTNVTATISNIWW